MVAFTRKYLLALAVAALVVAASGRAWAAQAMDAASESGGPISSWNLPYDPASENLVAGLQEFLHTEAGASVLAQAPLLSAIEKFNPKSEVHRRIVGALKLPVDLEGLMLVAKMRVKLANHGLPKEQADLAQRDFNVIGARVLSAYYSEDFQSKITGAVNARAAAIAAAASQDRISVAQLSAGSYELAPFAFVLKEARTVVIMAHMAKWTNTVKGAWRTAYAPIEGENTAADDAPVIVVGNNQKGLSRNWLQAYAITKKNRKMPREMINIAAMKKIGGAGADAALEFKGRKFRAFGILEAGFREEKFNSLTRAIDVYLTSEDGSRVKLYQKTFLFFLKRSAQRYFQSLPLDVPVIVDFKVAGWNRKMKSAPYDVKKIMRAAGPAPAANDPLYWSKLFISLYGSPDKSAAAKPQVDLAAVMSHHKRTQRLALLLVLAGGLPGLVWTFMMTYAQHVH